MRCAPALSACPTTNEDQNSPPKQTMVERGTLLTAALANPPPTTPVWAELYRVPLLTSVARLGFCALRTFTQRIADSY